jgi:predicted ester cyclase
LQDRFHRKRRVQLTQSNAAIVGAFVDEVINKGDFEAAKLFVWEDVVEQAPFPGQGPGLDGLEDVLRGMQAGFPDLHFSIKEQISRGREGAEPLRVLKNQAR